ncbi:YciI family protein [Cupriavidus sp. D39]|uniref:YciI family protein n=1 Tax=Cupriavidus sp. D39 TaxID=2997877 RepID=UPI00226D6082|nr:YciI family protein [Cupriavidus sp. D39]MCY0853478.1 YciI family protein [Cupriavidus sp. D39]
MMLITGRLARPELDAGIPPLGDEEMLWMINCTDKPNSAALREQYLATHRAYLDGWNDKIFFSGPQQSDDGSVFVGSFFIIDVPSRTEAQRFIEGETFHAAGVFESVNIRRLKKGRFHPQVAEAV